MTTIVFHSSSALPRNVRVFAAHPPPKVRIGRADKAMMNPLGAMRFIFGLLTATSLMFAAAAAAQLAPVLSANAGQDQTVNQGDAVSLNGTGSMGPPGAMLSYSWSQTGGSPTVTLTGANTATAGFTAPTGLTNDVTLTFTLTVSVGSEAMESETDTVDVTVSAASGVPPNPLSVNAGPDQTVDQGDAVSLSGSIHPASSAASYSWSQTGGSPTVTLTGANTAAPSFTAPTGLAADTTLMFTLTVRVGLNSATDTVAVTVLAAEFVIPLPTADAGPDQTVYEGDAVNLSGSSNPVFAGMSYSWSQTGGSPTVTLTGADTATPSFTAPTGLTADTTLTFTLTVTVGLDSAADTVNVIVKVYDPPTLSIDSPSVAEGDGDSTSLTFTVNLSTWSHRRVTVAYATADGTANAGTDYEATSGELQFAPGETELTVSVPVLGDTTPEADETVTLILSSPVNAELAHAEATGTIVNDDTHASVAHARAEEGDGGTTANIDFNVTLSAASVLEVTVAYATADGTASAGTDYEATSGELRFAPGQTELTVSVPVLGDTTPEADETFTLTLSSPVNAELGRAEATGTIVNDDTARLSVADARAEEGDGGTANIDFKVTLPAASDIQVTVAYATADATASAGTDYEATSGELRFAPGETELTVSVPARGDTTPEADETFTLTLSSPVNAELGRAEATGTIVNDDTALLSVADARAAEGDGGMANINFNVTLSAASDLEVTVAYATADGTASAGVDYEATSGELRFAPGETALSVSVPALGDTTPEADETFTLTLSSPTNAELARAQATGTIVNDDTALVSVADARAEEGDSDTRNIDFNVTLSTASDIEVTVAYVTADGTASAGTDYEATSGQLQFATGETALTVSVPVLGDTTPEADETFTLTLSGAANAELGRAATGVIVDDDRAEARDRALEASLAGFGRTFAQDAMGAVSGRFRRTPAAGGSQLTLGGSAAPLGGTPFGNQFADERMAPWASEAGWSPTVQTPGFRGFHDPAAPNPHGPSHSQRSLRDFLQRSSFDLALAEGGEGDHEARRLSLWGRASSGRFSGEPSADLSSDGDVVTGYLGLDAKVGERLIAGVALAHSDGEMAYGISNFSGELDVSLTSVLPYMHFQLNEKLEIWSMVGIGWGDGAFQDAVQVGHTALHDTRGKLDLGFSMAAVGANRALATWRNVDLELKSDAFVMLMDGESNGNEAQPDVKARSQGIRLTLAGHRELMASEHERLGVNLEFGGRWDGGDAQTGWGTEIGGGLDYRNACLGLEVAVQAQYLLVHRARSFEDKGVNVTLTFDPGVRGQGLSLALRPGWGAYSDGMGALWNNEALLLQGGPAPHTAPGAASERLDFELGYGFSLREDTGLLRLQGAVSDQGLGQRGYRFGGSLDLSERTRARLVLSRQEGLGTPSHGLLIEWQHVW